VRSYLSDAECVVAAGVLTALWLVIAVLPWWGQTLQEPIARWPARCPSRN
jgi:hypothetical protein